MLPATATGWFRILILHDVAEEIRLDAVRAKLPQAGAGGREREPLLRFPAPDYVRFDQPPVVEPIAPVTLQSGERLEGRVQYYRYGVVSVELVLPFEFGWDRIISLSNRWIAAPDIESLAAKIVQQCVERHREALIKPYAKPADEDYYLIQLAPMQHEDGRTVTAAELIAERGQEIAQIVRGESSRLSLEEHDEILQSRLSYYPTDLLVVGWTAAFVYDTPDGAAPTIQLLEYANTQLLEFRQYDETLSALLERVYQTLEKRRGLVRRWTMAREAERLNTILLDVRELTERVDNSIKFLSDMFAARVYRLAATKVGVPDYRRLVDEKLRTAGDLYHFMIDQFQHGRVFVLELMVVIILIIDLIYLFRGKA